jgi:signal transduction protein with GAF and PtsI domain
LQELALEAQMLDIINDLKKNAKLLKQCVAVCDVSGSMSGKPMDACIGLGIAINELNEGKFKGSILTFSAEPTWVKIGDAMTFK